MQRFDQLAAFQRALELMRAIYATTETFPKTEQYGLTSQLRRASISVLSHIAEGQGRLTVGEWRQMLSQGRGSLYEIEAQLLAARELEFLDAEGFATVRERAKRVGVALSGLIKYVQSREARPRERQPGHPTTRPPDK
jgi:four helix bundle protein